MPKTLPIWREANYRQSVICGYCGLGRRFKGQRTMLEWADASVGCDGRVWDVCNRWDRFPDRGPAHAAHAAHIGTHAIGPFCGYCGTYNGDEPIRYPSKSHRIPYPYRSSKTTKQRKITKYFKKTRKETQDAAPVDDLALEYLEYDMATGSYVAVASAD